MMNHVVHRYRVQYLELSTKMRGGGVGTIQTKEHNLGCVFREKNIFQSRQENKARGRQITSYFYILDVIINYKMWD